MTEAHVILSLARIATAVLAGTIGILGMRAYAVTRRRSILALSIGASLLAAGYLAEGLLVEAAGWSVHDATVLESVTTLVAAAVLVASLYLKESRPLAAEPGAAALAAPGSPR